MRTLLLAFVALALAACAPAAPPPGNDAATTGPLVTGKLKGSETITSIPFSDYTANPVIATQEYADAGHSVQWIDAVLTEGQTFKIPKRAATTYVVMTHDGELNAVTVSPPADAKDGDAIYLFNASTDGIQQFTFGGAVAGYTSGALGNFMSFAAGKLVFRDEMDLWFMVSES